MIEKLNQISPETGPHIYFPAFRYGLPLYTQAIQECFEQHKSIERIVLFSQYP